MSLNITTLIENSAAENSEMLSEHGLSFYIEYNGTKIVFDTGSSGNFLVNAGKLGIDLSLIDYVVLSHGHYDHTGGFLKLTECVSDFELITGTGFFREKYSYRKRSYRFLGNNFTEEDLRERGIKHRAVSDEITEIVPGLYVLTDFSRIHQEEKINPRFVFRESEGDQADLFRDEIVLAADTPEGLAVVIGCCHPGFRNIMDAVKERFERPVYAVFGGTHLVESSDENLDLTVEYLRFSGIRHLGLCHCTGDKAAGRLNENVPGYYKNCSGSKLSL